MHFVPGSAIGPIFSATVEKGKKVLDMEMKRQDLSARSLTLGLPPCILAVDDDEMSLMMIERILGESYEIVKVTSGKDALAYLSEHTVDLVLLDYMMPENDGITVLRRIRETLETADLPVILLTGDMTADLEARGFQAGATDFLHKPFFPDVLRLRVARILRYEYLQTHLEIEVEHKTALAEERLASSERLLDELILALAKTVDVKDRYTAAIQSALRNTRAKSRVAQAMTRRRRRPSTPSACCTISARSASQSTSSTRRRASRMKNTSSSKRTRRPARAF